MKLKDSLGHYGDKHIKDLPKYHWDMMTKLKRSYLEYMMDSVGVESYTISQIVETGSSYVIETVNEKLDIRSEIRVVLNSVFSIQVMSLVINSLSADKLYEQNFISPEEYHKYRKVFNHNRSFSSVDLAIKYISSRINAPLAPDYVIHITEYRYIIGSSKTPFKMYVLKRVKDGKILGKYFSKSVEHYIKFIKKCGDKAEDKDLLNDYLELFQNFEYVDSYYSIFKKVDTISKKNTLIQRINLTNNITFNLKCK